MKMVIDASVLLAVVLDEPERTWAIQTTKEGVPLAPRSFPFEVGNALTGLVKRKRLTSDGMHAAWKAAAAFKVTLRDIDITSALRLASVNNLYAYDAYMLQCALEANAVLVTLDRRMAVVGRTLGLDVQET